MNEEKLLRALGNSDATALERIMKKYSGYVCTVAWNFSRGLLADDTIDDISIEIFYKLWEQRERLDIKYGLKAYLSAASRNAVKNCFRRHGRTSRSLRSRPFFRWRIKPSFPI